MSELETAREASRKDHLPYEARHIDDVEWETIRCRVRRLTTRSTRPAATGVDLGER